MLDSVRGSHVVLLMGLVYVVQTAADDCPYNYPNGNIKDIPRNSLPSGLSSISLLRHPLTNITTRAFDNSATTLRNIYIRGARFDTIPRAFLQVTFLNGLDIEDTPIQNWQLSVLQHLAITVENLELINVSLSSWPTWVSNFHSLSKLDLSGNSLKSIPQNAFISFTDKLTMLKIQEAGLTHISPAISSLSSLTYLDISGNNFAGLAEYRTLTTSSFVHTLNLLFLNSVGLTQVPNLSNLTGIILLHLSNNQISSISAGSLPTSVSYLFLDENKISTVSPVFASLSKLSVLFITNNQISRIEPGAFPQSLTILGLSGNKLTSITPTEFANLNFLDRLHLDQNPISTIAPSALSDLVSLTHLSLTDTHLTEIPLAFTSLGEQIDIYLTTVQPLSCPCPADPELVQWFTSIESPFMTSASCSSGESVVAYLSGQCGH